MHFRHNCLIIISEQRHIHLGVITGEHLYNGIT